MLGRVVDVLYPRRCAGCSAGGWGRFPFCDGCRRRLTRLQPPWCRRCGAPAVADVAACRNCPPAPVARARAPFLFEGPARRAVHRLKFSGWRSVADALGTAMAGSAGSLAAVDVVTWVPLSRRRLAERGFDQARALAAVVGRRLDLPVVAMLERVSDAGGTQARRGGRARRQAIAGRFAAVRPSPERVLLVDDVLTTGATAGACASELVRAGAAQVSLLVAARSVQQGIRPGYTRKGPALGSVVAR